MKLGPKFKIARRLGAQVFEQTQTQRFAIAAERKGTRRQAPKSDYGKQFLEKQKVRISYGITERQFRNYIRETGDAHAGNPGEVLFSLLERRLDNVIYRLGLAKTRRAARQMVSHGHIVMGNRKVTVPSYRVSVGDVMKARDGSRTSPLFLNLAERLKDHKVPVWLTFDKETLEAKVIGNPTYVPTEHFFSLSPVLEFYSR